MSGPGPLTDLSQKASTAITSLLSAGQDERDPVKELQNLALDDKLLGLVRPLLEEVGYKVEPDTMTSRTGDSRPVTVGKKGEEKKFYLVRVPGWVLEQADEKNQAAIALLSYFFGRNSRLYIIANDLRSMDLAFDLMIREEWKETKNITAVFIPWNYLIAASGAKTVQQRLIYIKRAFEFEGELVAVSPSSNGGSGTAPAPPSNPSNGAVPGNGAAPPARKVESPLRTIPMDLKLKPDDIDALVDIMQTRAASPLQSGPQQYFRNLVAAAHLPKKYKATIAGRFQGNAEADARALTEDAIDKKINSEDTRFTVLGSIVMALLKQDTSPDDARTMIAILQSYGLILDDSERERLAVRFMLPELAAPGSGEKVEYGPEIEWLGPEGVQLQGFLRPDPPWLDVGFLRKAMERSSAICRIELGTRMGTGFLVGKNLVLTNYHVLVYDSGDNLEENAKKTVLRFGCFSAKNDTPDGQVFKLAPGPIVDQSPVDEHDFLLLRVQEAIQDEEAITPAPLQPSIPAEKSPLNIIHHPFGDTMKLSLSGNGVTGIYRDKGLLQYVTRAAEGSSGSPCFNDEWDVVGLHHAQRARSFGSIREGILIHAIYDRIQQHLD